MMLTITEFNELLETKFPEVVIFNSTVDKDSDKCIGVFSRSAGKIQAIGGPDNGSYDILPISIIVHWTEDAGQAEEMANAVYTALSTIMKEETPAGTMITYVQLQDATPVHIGRDESNVVEKVIRANIYYERGA